MYPKVYESEYRFCLVLWRNEPISRSDIAKLCAKELGWSRTTTYTVIKRLSERGVLKCDGAIVTTLVSKEEVQVSELDEMLEKTFEGSVPDFIAAFARRQKLSEKEIEQIVRMIKTEE